MQFLKSGLLAGTLLATALCLSAQEPRVVQGIPPRVAPTEYQAQGRAGQVSFGAEFEGHGVQTTADSTFNSEEYVVVEVGIFGAAGSKIALSPDDFSLRVNGKKAALPSQPYGLVVKSLKNPEWEASVAVEKLQKSKTSIGGDGGGGGGGGGGQDNTPPPAPKMPIEVRRAMELKVQKASLPEGERALPLAGLLYFQYSGKVKGMKSVELVYKGPAGTATIPLQP